MRHFTFPVAIPQAYLRFQIDFRSRAQTLESRAIDPEGRGPYGLVDVSHEPRNPMKSNEIEPFAGRFQAPGPSDGTF